MTDRKHFRNLPKVSCATYNAALYDFRGEKQSPVMNAERVAEFINELEELSPDLARMVKNMEQQSGWAKRHARNVLFALYCFDRQMGSDKLEQWFGDEKENK